MVPVIGHSRGTGRAVPPAAHARQCNNAPVPALNSTAPSVRRCYNEKAARAEGRHGEDEGSCEPCVFISASSQTLPELSHLLGSY